MSSAKSCGALAAAAIFISVGVIQLLVGIILLKSNYSELLSGPNFMTASLNVSLGCIYGILLILWRKNKRRSSKQIVKVRVLIALLVSVVVSNSTAAGVMLLSEGNELLLRPHSEQRIAYAEEIMAAAYLTSVCSPIVSATVAVVTLVGSLYRKRRRDYEENNTRCEHLRKRDPCSKLSDSAQTSSSSSEDDCVVAEERRSIRRKHLSVDLAFSPLSKWTKKRGEYSNRREASQTVDFGIAPPPVVCCEASLEIGQKETTDRTEESSSLQQQLGGPSPSAQSPLTNAFSEKERSFGGEANETRKVKMGRRVLEMKCRSGNSVESPDGLGNIGSRPDTYTEEPCHALQTKNDSTQKSLGKFVSAGIDNRVPIQSELAKNQKVKMGRTMIKRTYKSNDSTDESFERSGNYKLALEGNEFKTTSVSNQAKEETINELKYEFPSLTGGMHPSVSRENSTENMDSPIEVDETFGNVYKLKFTEVPLRQESFSYIDSDSSVDTPLPSTSSTEASPPNTSLESLREFKEKLESLPQRYATYRNKINSSICPKVAALKERKYNFAKPRSMKSIPEEGAGASLNVSEHSVFEDDRTDENCNVRLDDKPKHSDPSFFKKSFSPQGSFFRKIWFSNTKSSQIDISDLVVDSDSLIGLSEDQLLARSNRIRSIRKVVEERQKQTEIK